MKTAELSVAKKLSVYGTTEPRYFCTSSGMLLHRLGERAEDDPQLRQLRPEASSPTETLSNTASTATPASSFCSSSGMPELLEGVADLRIDLVQAVRASASSSGAE